MKVLVFVCVLYTTTIIAAREGFGPTNQDWGYVEVREGAHIFWWLHYTTSTTKATEKPLIIWLQGGPGASSTQYGNFEEIGPLDRDLNPRNTTWVQYANILFVDNPVGAGFSYVESEDLLTTTNKQIADDFAAQNNSLKSNIKGVGLGNSWISPRDFILSWVPYLYNLGYLDTKEFKELTKDANAVKGFMDEENWASVNTARATLLKNLDLLVGGVDWYNILDAQNTSLSNSSNSVFNLGSTGKEGELMSKVKAALNLTSEWGGFVNPQVNLALAIDINKPVIDVIEKLLNETDISVTVYNGHLDMAVPTVGVIQWLDHIAFKGSENWSQATKKSFVVNGIVEGYERNSGNLRFYSVLRSGHMVPAENPYAMLHILQEVTNNFQV